MTLDGNSAVALSAYATNDVAIIYPITPSSPMAESCDEWASKNTPNIYNNVMKIVEMQSEGGAAGALHGSLLTGSLTTTFTASQGLLLMIPNMYKIAGELLPCVFHVSARTIATHALNIFGDHSDVMACRQTGFAMLASSNVQEAHDFATIAMMTTLNSRVPFLHFFDGFRTSHEIQKISVLETADYLRLIPQDAINAHRKRGMSPMHPTQHGTAQNSDVFFQNREACEIYYQNVRQHILDAMHLFGTITGRQYSPYEYYGPKNPTKLIVTMGSSADTIQSVIDDINKTSREKTGLLKVRLYRPFFAKDFCNAIPKSVKYMSVLDRTKESGSLGEPLYLDCVTALAECGRHSISILGGRYGLGGKDFTPQDAYAVIENTRKNGKNHFTVGIIDDILHTNLPSNNYKLNFDGTSCIFYGLGSDGTVSANKNTIKMVGNNSLTPIYAQGYFVYDSKKSGSVTISHLRFSKSPILAPYNITTADFVACHNPRFIGKYDILSSLKDNGTLLLNCEWTTDNIAEHLPVSFKRELLKRNIKLYIINAFELAERIGLKGKINTIMQSAFFALNILPFPNALEHMRTYASTTYAKAGETVVKMNHEAIEQGATLVQKVDIPTSWLNAENTVTTQYTTAQNTFSKNIMLPIAKLNGNNLPTSVFSADGSVPTDTSRFEKRGIAQDIPEWIPENCIQCNMCSTICPHGAIRAVLVDKNTPTPKNFVTVCAKGYEDKEYRIQVSPLDCTGCGCCVNVCPSVKKALVMRDGAEQIKKQNKNHILATKLQNNTSAINKTNIKGLQFAPTYFQYCGACGGCGETAYIKMATQLFGDSMLIANATGCSSIYGGSYPACPYTKDANGHGPAWANSLFEDNAEFGLGMRIALDAQLNEITTLINEALTLKSSSKKELLAWLNMDNNLDENKIICKNLIHALTAEYKLVKGKLKTTIGQILKQQDKLFQKSVWIIGGDGWAYDIGYGGLDHVLASNMDVNILVLDTQVYSNTGGQSSKATPVGAVAKFADSGKRTARKSLSMMALNYPNTYVAQVSLGANMNHTLQCMREAQLHHGPSIIIAYAPCINHGIDMSNTTLIERQAVQSGYWHLFHYTPSTQKLHLDSGEPTMDYIEFAKTQRRFANLFKKEPTLANDLLEQAKLDNQKLFEKLKKLAS